MFAQSAEKLTQQLLHHNVIAKEQYEICKYGFQQGFTVLLNIAVISVIGLSMGVFLHAMIFLAAFIPLRRFAGGFHAKTPVRCCLYSAGLMTAILLAIKLSVLTHFICIIIFSVSCIAVALLAPVEDKQKPLDNTERLIFRKRSHTVAAIETVLFITSIVLQLNSVLVCLTWACAAAAALLAAGVCKNALTKSHRP